MGGKYTQLWAESKSNGYRRRNGGWSFGIREMRRGDLSECLRTSLLPPRAEMATVPLRGWGGAGQMGICPTKKKDPGETENQSRKNTTGYDYSGFTSGKGNLFLATSFCQKGSVTPKQ